jgi:branched-chain amino acid transport system substrate-binding protein
VKPYKWFGLVVLLVAFAFVLAGCSNSNEEANGGTSTPSGPTPGVTDTEILLGTHLALSGSPAAASAPYADGMKAYFDYINSQGGIYGRKIKLVVGDDHFSPPDAMEVVRQQVQQQEIFAEVGEMGDPVDLATAPYLAEQGVPNMFVAAGCKVFTDPLVHTRIGMTNYDIETQIVSEYFNENFPGKKMALLVPETESGTGAINAFKANLDGVEIVETQSYDILQSDVTAQIQRMKAANPDFVYLWANVGVAANGIKVIRQTLDWDVPIYIASVAATEILTALTGNEAAEGIISMTPGKMISETDDAGVQRHIELMKQFAPNVPPSGITMYGMSVAEFMVQALQNAGPDLTRESLIAGAEKIKDFCCLECLTPTNLSSTNHAVGKALFFETFTNGNWVRQSDTPISLEPPSGDVIACKGAGEPVYKNGQ